MTGESLWYVSYAGSALALTVFGLHRYWMLWLYWRSVQAAPRKKAAAPEGELPPVTVQVPIYNERFVAERVIDAVALLDYPADRLEIQILDDSTDETREICERRVAHWRERGRDIHHVTRPHRSGFKAGALAYGLERAKSDLIAVFDADFVPDPSFLREMVPYFDEPTVGVVQARWGHLNRESSWLTRAQAIMLDAHFRLEQAARHRSGRFFNFNGTAGIWRRQAIHEAGGWHHDTLTEDLDLSYRAQLAGWRFVYLDDVAAPAELPADMDAFKSQQHRWAKGSVQTAIKLLPRIVTANLPLTVKLDAAMHLGAYLVHPVALVFCFASSPALIHAWSGDAWSWALFQIPFLIATLVSVVLFYITSILLSGGGWRDVAALPVVLALGTGIAVNNTRAVVEAVAGVASPFHRTPKSGAVGRTKPRLSGYASIRSLVVLFEVLFVLRSLQLIWEAVALGQFGTIPFLMTFLCGFGYVAGRSLLERFRSGEDRVSA